MSKGERQQLSFTFGTVVTPRGDGSFVVTPGKPSGGTMTVAVE
jgi:hypothetical protein